MVILAAQFYAESVRSEIEPAIHLGPTIITLALGGVACVGVMGCGGMFIGFILSLFSRRSLPYSPFGYLWRAILLGLVAMTSCGVFNYWQGYCGY